MAGLMTKEEERANNPMLQKFERERQIQQAKQDAIDAEKNRRDVEPLAPILNSLLDENGNLKPQYRLYAQPDIVYSSNIDELQKQLGGIQLDKQGLNKIKERAFSTAPSQWAQLMEQKQRLMESGNLDAASEGAQSATSSALSGLASHGGLSSGARERVGTIGARDLAMAQQNVRREGQKERLGISTADEEQRLDLLKQIPGYEVQALEPELKKTSLWSSMAGDESRAKADLGLKNREYSTGIDKLNKEAAISENARLDSGSLAAYQEQMKKYAAEKQAQATAASSSGGKK